MNVQSGYILHKCVSQVKNDALDAVNFSSIRLRSDREALMQAHDAYQSSMENARDIKAVHHDIEWIKQHFIWQVPPNSVADMEPVSLWGTHDSYNPFLKYNRELGVDDNGMVRLYPDAVRIAANDPTRAKIYMESLSEIAKRHCPDVADD
jgi:hypothetical protein